MLIPQLRARLVTLVAALVIQGTIAAIRVLPDLPGVDAAGFWAKFAVLELLAAVIVSGAFGPRVGLRDVPMIGRLVLGIAFLALPAVAVVLGGIDAARAATTYGASATASSWLGTAFFAIVFFGLPAIALAAPTPTPARARDPQVPQAPLGQAAR